MIIVAARIAPVSRRGLLVVVRGSAFTGNLDRDKLSAREDEGEG